MQKNILYHVVRLVGTAKPVTGITVHTRTITPEKCRHRLPEISVGIDKLVSCVLFINHFLFCLNLFSFIRRLTAEKNATKNYFFEQKKNPSASRSL